ncbi:hypothetical protein PP175_25290 (plasmid) [Aneurinibacillus sp. Ricciae_BoGa-3]|uniref:hypothetical protein n=1 Tax=Aneurinibacillus sp. Ricciae_BoGa-3 TaxID=3022697 RepID=UPI00234050B6|nr:hypothetical protein [Aneurinibacillus sp. Ricciae_BoGa-3]WCK57384.1 hypothetical protein PP175_25290 [Aneurinibacillus sp. Ricciae_BoGa-3]
MAIFYHVSTNLRHPGVFEPRIPSFRHKQAEDTTTPRISVAPTIEDCLTAIPNGGAGLEELNTEQRGCYLIFKIDTEKLGITDDQVVTSEVLYEKDLVRDADVTNEHWITVPFTVPAEDQFIIKLIDWEVTPLDILPQSIYQIADEQYEGDYLRAYMEVYGEHVPCSVGIVNASCIHEDVLVGQEITFYFEDEFEKNMIQEFIKENYPIEITDESMDGLTMFVQENCNLRELFLYHEQLVHMYA